MSDVGQIERKAQERVVGLFRDRLGYDYLGNWEYRGNADGLERAAEGLRQLGDHVFEFFLRNKRAEYEQYLRQVTPLELTTLLPAL